MKNRVYLIQLLFMTFFSVCYSSNPIKVLLLSGNNNHDWQTTTPCIKQILEANGNCCVDITERPDTLHTEMLLPYHVIVSNWNSFPEQTSQWNKEARQALENYLGKRKGFVTIHAASAAHYDWPSYLEITAGRWGDKTHHGKPDEFCVQIDNKEHPITKGLGNFNITDELWIDLECHPKAEILCTAASQPVLLVTQYRKSRCVYLVLGHDTTVMRNPNWQVLLLRTISWAAYRKINKE